MKTLALIIYAVITLTNTAKADMPSTHGMVIFGDKVTYASHLPMFHTPHNYQVILKIEMQEAPTRLTKYTIEKYKKIKANTGDMFTLMPQPMDLSEIIKGTKTEFYAGLYQGHFEKGGKLLGNVIVTITQVLFSAKLNPQAKDQHEYFVFGENGEYFAAHKIEGTESIDEILEVAQIMVKKDDGLCHLRFCPSTYEKLDDAKLPLTFASYLDEISTPIPVGTIIYGVQQSPLSTINTTITKEIYLEKEL